MPRFRRKLDAAVNDSGHDAFLDIVANLVGILVILIMVVGVRARNAWQNSTPQPIPSISSAATAAGVAPLETIERRLADKLAEVTELQRDAHRLDAQSRQVAAVANAKRHERDKLQLLVSAAEADIAERQLSLGEHDQTRFAVLQEMDQAKQQLAELQQATHAIKSTAPTEEKVLLHHLTPVAKTVFGREEHFRLLGGYLVHVPMQAIVDQLRADAENKLWKLKDADETTESIGPIGGFRARYAIERRQRGVMTEAGPAVQRTIELAQFTLIAASEQMGDPIGDALQADSAFFRHIRSLSHSDTTLTVWVYPDSFTAYRQLKEALQPLGFQVAARPMPDGQPIGGSPQGSRSTAE